MSEPVTKSICFFCDGIAEDILEKDHFPVPVSAGGNQTVPSCYSCHSMKDRYNLRDWPIVWTTRVLADFPKLNRETKIFLAKALRVSFETEPSIGDIFFNVREFEQEIKRNRIMGGLARAKKSGKSLGRPRVKVDLAEIHRLKNNGYSIRKIAAMISIPSATVSRDTVRRALS